MPLRPPPSMSTAAAAAFKQRLRELDEAHARRATLQGGLRSWLLQWLRGQLPPALGGTSLLPRRPAPPIPLPAPGECALTWIGHATCVIRYARGRVVTDPCLARRLKSLNRLKPPQLPPGALEGVDLVLLSHAHADHLHRPSLERIDRSATVVLPAGGPAKSLRALGFGDVVEVRPGDVVKAPGLEVTAVAAQHAVGAFGGGRALGYVTRGDGPTVYFAGDSGYFDGFMEVGARFRPDVALLPISGYRPLALRQDHLSPLDAIYAFEDLGAQLLLPIHHGAFPLGYEAPSEPLIWLRSAAAARRLEGKVAWLEPGDSCVARRPPLQTSPPSDMQAQ